MHWAAGIMSRPGGGGRSVLPLKNCKIRLETIYFKLCHYLHYIIIIIVKVGLSKEKFFQHFFLLFPSSSQWNITHPQHQIKQMLLDLMYCLELSDFFHLHSRSMLNKIVCEWERSLLHCINQVKSASRRAVGENSCVDQSVS